MSNSTFIGFNAGVDIKEGDNIVIIGDNVRSLDKSQSNVLFIGKNVAIGEYLFGQKINIKEIMEKYINDKNDTKGEKRLILSRIQTPDGTILTSYHVHDYVTHTDKNGEKYMLDGGLEYQRYNVCKEPFKDLSVWSDAPFEVIRESFHRGGRGKDNKQPLTWVPISKMSDEWLEATIQYNIERDMIMNFATKLYVQEQDYRKENNISIKE